MRIIVKPNAQSASEYAAALVRAQLEKKPDLVLGLPTGSTPLDFYAEMVRRHREEGLDFSGVTSFNLDEYLGIGPQHPGSFHAYMQRNLFAHINIDPARAHIPDGLTRNPARTCREYEELILQAGGIDMQLLGLGRDGHVGFNEPGSPLDSRTRVETLTALTREDNAASFSGYEHVPERALTMGVGTILEASEILLLIFGAHKAEIAKKALEGPLTPMVPASALQLHGNTTAILDQEAAGLLERKGGLVGKHPRVGTAIAHRRG